MRRLPIDEAIAHLRRGGVIAYPTEAVWGVGCDPADEATVLRLLALKQREIGKGLILVAAHLDQLRPWIDLDTLPPQRVTEVQASWPGPHTWILPAAASAPRWITGDHDGIAVRVSAHPVVIALCEAFGGALVSTSANPAGAPPPASAEDLDPALLQAIDGLTVGETGGLARPTAIRDARTGRVLRA
jgi:L-threonylcarbamoyladenylate synthase